MTSQERHLIAAMELIAAAEESGSSGQCIVLTTDPRLRDRHPHGMLAYGPFPEIEAVMFADRLRESVSVDADLDDMRIDVVPWAAS